MSDTESKIREYTLQFSIGLGDDSLMLGQRLGEWCRNAPMLEEDLAITNVALDFLGRANMYYEYAVKLAKITGGDFQDQSVDDIAYLRDSREY
ncbi:MAG: Phenylacetic acid catabolic protein, partial [bacterium]